MNRIFQIASGMALVIGFGLGYQARGQQDDESLKDLAQCKISVETAEKDSEEMRGLIRDMVVDSCKRGKQSACDYLILKN